MASGKTYRSGFPHTPPIRQCFPSWPYLYLSVQSGLDPECTENRCFPTPGGAKTEPSPKAQRSDSPRLSSLSVLALSAYAYQEALPLLLALLGMLDFVLSFGSHASDVPHSSCPARPVDEEEASKRRNASPASIRSRVVQSWWPGPRISKIGRRHPRHVRQIRRSLFIKGGSRAECRF